MWATRRVRGKPFFGSRVEHLLDEFEHRVLVEVPVPEIGLRPDKHLKLSPLLGSRHINTRGYQTRAMILAQTLLVIMLVYPS